MSGATTNYGLVKPLPEEFYDVAVQNGNMDIIDAELKRADVYARSLMLGYKDGLEIYYAGEDDIRIRPGTIHVTDGVEHRLHNFAEEISLTGESGMVGWKFIVIDVAGNIVVRDGDGLTGTPEQRPTDAFFQWAGYDRVRQGYYYYDNGRIIGAFWRYTATKYYIINCGMGTDEIGENALGSWERRGNIQRVWGRSIHSVKRDIAVGSFFSTPNLTIVWPVTFLSYQKVIANLQAIPLSTNVYMWAITGNLPSVSKYEFVKIIGTSQSVAELDHHVDFYAIGKWR